MPTVRPKRKSGRHGREEGQRRRESGRPDEPRGRGLSARQRARRRRSAATPSTAAASAASAAARGAAGGGRGRAPERASERRPGSGRRPRRAGRAQRSPRRSGNPRRARRAGRARGGSRPVLDVADVDAAHQVEVALLVALGELLVALRVGVVRIDGESTSLKLSARLRVEAVLELRDALVVVAAQQVRARVLVVAVRLEDAPEDRDRRLVLALVVELDGRRQLGDLLRGGADALREGGVLLERRRRQVEVLQRVDVALLGERLLGRSARWRRASGGRTARRSLRAFGRAPASGATDGAGAVRAPCASATPSSFWARA